MSEPSSGAGHEARGGGHSGNRRGHGRGRARGNRGRGGQEHGQNAQRRRDSTSTTTSGNIIPTPNLSHVGIQNPAAQDVAATASASKARHATEAQPADDDDDDADVCFICANPVAHHSIAPCNHTTCHICGLRMRALYKDKNCAHCRTAAPFVIFAQDTTKPFEEYTDADVTTIDSNIGIKYANEDIVGDTVLLLRYNCPDGDCDFAGLGWPDLHRHVKSAHKKRMCDLCTRNKRVFTHEHELFAEKELERHMRHGDDKPGAADQTGFKGHPLCGFCGQRFYDDDKLYEHCRMKHERCFICDRRDSRHPHYFINYNALEEHFRKDHYLCNDRECMEKKFVVFESEMDLQAHRLSEHSANGLGKEARVVDMSGFDLRQTYQEPRGSRGQGRGRREERGGRARGRDQNAEQPPPPTPQALRRDEIAFQRQMAIHSTPSLTNRTFGGQLTPAAPAAPAASSQPQSHTQTPQALSRNHSQPTTPRPSSSNNNNNNNNANPLDAAASTLVDYRNLTPDERANHVRHGAVIERAANLLGNDQRKMKEFRDHISSFRQGKNTAPQLVDAFFTLFSETSSTALGTLVRELSDLFDDKAKGASLRQAWQDWRAINEDYPSLPGLTGMHGETSASSGWALAATVNPAAPNQSQPSQKHSNRVLKLKNSTRLAGPAPVAANRYVPGWNSAPATRPPVAAASFPSLPSAAGPSKQAAGNAKPAPKPSWITGSAAQTASSSSSSGQASSSSNPRAPRPKATQEAFPSLPAAPKPQTTIFGYGGGRGVRRDLKSADSGFSWGGSPASEAPPAVEEEASGAGGKGKKKGKKQVLVQWG